jgi:hypothetical protein
MASKGPEVGGFAMKGPIGQKLQKVSSYRYNVPFYRMAN